jgi:plastocyanin
MRSGRTWILLATLSLTPALGFTSRPDAAAPKVVQIDITKATFGDTPAGIVVGDTIEWVNKDIFDHTATSRVGGWDVVIPAGKKARVVMKRAGVFDYVCRFHPNMTGSVTVKKPKA